MRLTWLDIRNIGEAKDAVLAEAIHQRVSGIMAADPAEFAALPPTVTRVLMATDRPQIDATGVDVVIVSPDHVARVAAEHPDVEVGAYVDVIDAESLQLACRMAASCRWSVLSFRDPTKIPLEIVLAAADTNRGGVITTAADVTEAEIILGVLERGSDGVLLAPTGVGEVTALQTVARARAEDLPLVELSVTGITHVGMGERACVDTCTYLNRDEGILIGSRATGMILGVSETHPLPYMPTRPFRVNAGAIHSYVVGPDGRTNYLSELRAGSRVLAVDVKGASRIVTVGRVKIESRPLLSVDAVAPDGTEINLILQDDWHVRLLGPGGTVHNCTELTAGTRLLGYLPTSSRHVGYPIDEFCREQ